LGLGIRRAFRIKLRLKFLRLEPALPQGSMTVLTNGQRSGSDALTRSILIALLPPTFDIATRTIRDRQLIQINGKNTATSSDTVILPTTSAI